MIEDYRVADVGAVLPVAAATATAPAPAPVSVPVLAESQASEEPESEVAADADIGAEVARFDATGLDGDLNDEPAGGDVDDDGIGEIVSGIAAMGLPPAGLSMFQIAC